MLGPTQLATPFWRFALSEFPPNLPATWTQALEPAFAGASYRKLVEFIGVERSSGVVLPPSADVFAAFRATPLDAVKVVILGQDPYPTAGQGHGLAFSVRPGVKLPGSLRNIFKEREADLGLPPSKHGHLVAWATQGVLLLNAVLTVREGKPGSHAKKGWEEITDAALQAVDGLPRRVAFVLWGAFAQRKARLVDERRHTVIRSAHPSPLSAHTGFFGSRPFSRVNEALEASGQVPIDWSLPEPAAPEI